MDADYTAGRFYDDARASTELVLAKGAVPIIVGGTGMYLRWCVAIYLVLLCRFLVASFLLFSEI